MCTSHASSGKFPSLYVPCRRALTLVRPPSRGRKIRCDGAKPICHNCSRRTENPHICSYDSAPKRRGPDKVPGARQRSAGSTGDKPPRRRRRPLNQDGTDQLFVDPQSVPVSPADPKSNPFNPTAHTFLADAPPPHPDNLTIIQEAGPGQYTRHRHGLPEPDRGSMSGGVLSHYSHPHTLVGSSASLADINASTHPTHIDPSGRL